MQFEKWYDIDLKKPRQFMPDLGFPVFKGDKNSVRVGVHMFSNKEPLDVTGSVEGYVLLPNGAMAPVITGEKEGNAAWIDLSELSLAIIGRIQVAIRLVDGTEETVIFCATATVRRVGSETIIDPDDVIPTWDDILDKIAAMDAAAQECEEAAADATAAASHAVRYDEAQTLTDSQKEVARGNIEAASEQDVSDLRGALNPTPILLTSLDTFILCYLAGGTKITIRTTSGDNFTVRRLYLYNRDKELDAQTDYYELSAFNTNQRTLTIPSGKTYYYVALVGGTAQDIEIVNAVANTSGEIATLAEEAAKIAEQVAGVESSVTSLEDDLETTNAAVAQNQNRIALLETDTLTLSTIGADSKVVFFAKSGDSITVSSSDDSTLPTGLQIRFADRTGTAVEYANLGGYKTRTFDITGTDKEIYYAYLFGDVTLSTTITLKNNSEKTRVDQLANRTNQLLDILDSTGNVKSLIGLMYDTIILAENTQYPVTVNNGDVFIVKTLDGKPFVGNRLNLYDADGNYVNYYGVGSSYGNQRGIASSLDFTYVAYNAAQPLYVINISKANAPLANQITNTIWKYDAEIDRKSIEKNAVKKFVFFSDVHGSSINTERVFEYAERAGVDAIINGGDTVATAIVDGYDWYNTRLANASMDVLNCVGNHDAWTSQSTSEQADPADIYNAFIQPMVTKGISIVQPTGASTNHLCYYYIDYGAIRVIVMYAMIGPWTIGWTNDQLTWFVGVLADAKTAGKAVICVNHAPYRKEYADIDGDCPLNSFIDYTTFSFDNLAVPQEAVSAVNDFKEAGGEFICWLTGHTHADYIMENNVYSGQMMINIATARSTRHFDGYAPAQTETWSKNFDCFDYIGIDTTNKIVKVLRIGYAEDASMRVRHRFGYNYAINKLVSWS